MNTLYLTIGAPASGKSTYSKNFIKDKDIEYLSSDELRAKFGSGESDQTCTNQVFDHIKKKVVEYLEMGIIAMIMLIIFYRNVIDFHTHLV